MLLFVLDLSLLVRFLLVQILLGSIISSSINSVIASSSSSLPIDIMSDVNTKQIQDILYKYNYGKIVFIDRLQGALTNQVYKIIAGSPNNSPILIRIYGMTKGEEDHRDDGRNESNNNNDNNNQGSIVGLFNREREEEYTRVLSRIGITPKWFHSFPQGRIEEWIDGNVLSSDLLKNPQISSIIAKKMRKMHQSIENVNNNKDNGLHDRLKKWREMAWSSFSFLNSSSSDSSFSSHDQSFRLNIQMIKDILNYRLEIPFSSRPYSHSHGYPSCDSIVLGHCDLHSLNMMISKKEGNIYFIDLEYVLPVPAAYDIANHFNEWMADYSKSLMFEDQKYPTESEQKRFLESYLNIDEGSSFSLSGMTLSSSNDNTIKEWLERIKVYSKVSHLLWAYWCIIQIAHSKMKGEEEESNYWLCLKERFRKLMDSD